MGRKDRGREGKRQQGRFKETRRREVVCERVMDKESEREGA